MNNDWNPGRYDERASFVSDLASDLLLWLRPAPGEQILDLGSGTGDLAAKIASHGARVVGVDRSPAMVASAKAKYPELCFAVADGQALELSPEFDAVFSNAALHWMPRAGDVLDGVRRALRPGGRFVAEFGGHGCVATVTRAVAEVLAEWQIDAAPYLNWFFPRPGEYAGLLEAHGFVPRQVHYFERPTAMPGEAGLGNWLGLFQAQLMTDLADRWPDLCRLVSARCRSALYRDGQWFLDYVRLRFLATKPG